MCFSAMVKQGLKKGLKWQARIQTDGFDDLFRQRVHDDNVKVAKALEANFYDPQTPAETRIKQYIDQYHELATKEYETDLFKQRRRLADAKRKLQDKQTKKALDEQRIADNKVAWLMRRLADLRRTELVEKDSRIFPFWYAPVFVWEDGGFVIRPMRYHCRPREKSASIDKRFPGLYNARRDNLEGFWKNQFGKNHGFIIATSFFENVARNDFEHRELEPGEKSENLILHFNPQPPTEMYLACLWDCWQSPGKPDLYSFAAITDDPPAEVAATGHNRCIIPLKEKNLRAWLTPEGQTTDELYQLLDDRERPHYRHALAA